MTQEEVEIMIEDINTKKNHFQKTLSRQYQKENNLPATDKIPMNHVLRLMQYVDREMKNFYEMVDSTQKQLRKDGWDVKQNMLAHELVLYGKIAE